MANVQDFQIAPRIIFENIDGEVIIINLEVGLYYSLHNIAAQIWDLIERKAQTEQIINTLAKHYQKDAQTIGTVVEQFLHKLEQASLIMPVSSQSATQSSEQQQSNELKLINPPETFTEPELEEYTDMKELLLIDPVHEVDEEGWPHRSSVAEENEK